MILQPLRHPDFQKVDDATLDQAARAHISRTAGLQLLAELIEKLRGFPWWNPQDLRNLWGANERMGWLRERPDVRQRITTLLTGLAPKAARNKAPEFQAGLIDSVVEDGDVSVRAFEDAFSPIELVIYGPAPHIWKAFRDRMPWRDESPAHRQLIEWLLEELLASKSRAHDWKRRPVLTALALRSAIPGRIWHLHVPLDIRVAIDEARLERERTRPTEPFLAQHELGLATPQILAAHLPLRELVRVLEIAEKEMGLSLPAPAPAQVVPVAPGSQPGSGTHAAVNARVAPSGGQPAAAAAGPASVDGRITTPPAGSEDSPSSEIPVSDEDFAFDDV